MFLIMILFPVITVCISNICSSQCLVTVAPPVSPKEFAGQYLTITQILENVNISAVFNTSNTTIEFLPGEHEIDGLSVRQVVIFGVSNIIWRGLSGKKTFLRCKQEFAFVFKEIINLTLGDLTIYNCGYSHISFHASKVFFLGFTKGEIALAALLLQSVNSIRIINVTIQNSKGYGLLAVNMLGVSIIESSVFLENNLQTKLNNEVGGNALIFYSHYHPCSTSDTVYLIVNNSYFLNGSSSSSSNFTVFSNLHANGLGLLITPISLKVNVLIEKVTFSGNIKNLLHPSVRIVENATTASSVVFSDCTFEHEGTLNIWVSSENYFSAGIPCFIKIENCSFTRGIGTGIKIYVHDSPRLAHLNNSIIISNCVFSDFGSHTHQAHIVSVFQVRQIAELEICFQVIRVKIFGSIFQNNRIRALHFIVTTYSQHDKHPCPSITISNCIYRNNHSPNDYLVYVVAVYSERQQLAVVSYESDLSKGFRLDQVEFESSTFINNRLNQGSYKGIIYLKDVFASFSNCLFLNSVGSALQATDSVVSLLDANYFVSNTGKEGGGLSLIRSRLHLNENSATIFLNNTADYGGGLFGTPSFVKTLVPFLDESLTCPLCSLSLKEYSLAVNLNLTVYFADNTARYSGNSIFYGTFSHCCVSPDCSMYECSEEYSFIQNSSLVNLFTFSSQSAFELSTIPNNLLVCDSASMKKNNYMTVYTFPGANFNISLRVEGEYLEIPPVLLTAKLCNDYNRTVCMNDYQSEYPYGAYQQLATHQCSNITYKVHSIQEKVYLEIRINRLQGARSSVEYYDRRHVSIYAEINILPCPLGYHILNQKPNCECNEYLLKLGVKCDINKGGKVLPPKGMWLGYQSNSTVASKYCPFDYCIPADCFFSLSSPEEQCEYSRSGILCGECRGNLSVVLGTSNCKECSNRYLLLIIPFALAGVALVVLLLKCNLTVSVGHINGLIIYANIVHMNKALLFQNKLLGCRVLATFIAWLNLDLGIETCFFKRMNTYSKVWLQFVFPVYLWVMAGLIVILAHYSSRAGRLIGSNSVPVLATLFILSYAKLLRTIIAAVSFTFIEFEDGSPDVTVWLWDANVQYLSPKHSALFFVAILFTFGYIVPLTLFFFFSPCLQSISHKKAFRWVNKWKPFLDANQGPYSDKYRWWSGLLLIVRVILLSIYASNYNNDAAMNFYWTLFFVVPLAMFCLIKQAVYRYRLTNCLESASLLNVVVLCAVNWLSATTDYKKWGDIGDYATCISISVSMILFAFVVLYQVCKKLHPCTCAIVKKKETNYVINPIADHEMIVKAPTSSVVEINRQSDHLLESLLDS